MIATEGPIYLNKSRFGVRVLRRNRLLPLKSAYAKGEGCREAATKFKAQGSRFNVQRPTSKASSMPRVERRLTGKNSGCFRVFPCISSYFRLFPDKAEKMVFLGGVLPLWQFFRTGHLTERTPRHDVPTKTRICADGGIRPAGLCRVPPAKAYRDGGRKCGVARYRSVSFG